MKPFSLLIKPAGPDCNLDCKYCFYKDKKLLFGAGRHCMNGEILERLVKDYLSLRFPVSSFAWQGGEPTLMGLDFYKKAVELQQQFSQNGQVVSNALQTNGILLNDKWCEFLRKYKFLVGISLDGPKDYHDYYRINKAGKGTFDKVIMAVEKCRKHKVEFNILVLLNNRNVTAPDKLLGFFIEHSIEYVQFIPCVEKETNVVSNFSITPKQYGEFLCRIFDCWYEYGPEKLSIRLFDSTLNYLVHGEHTNCIFRRSCNDYIVIEHNGDVFCCDFFVDQEYRLGNILEKPIGELFRGQRKQRFARQKETLHNKCLICRHSAICRGGCLKERVVVSNDFVNPSYFCESYKRFFDYSLPRLAQYAAGIVNPLGSSARRSYTFKSLARAWSKNI